MCGIAGIVNLDGAPASLDHLRAMLDVLAHRGPDGSGVVARGPVALGHRRLSIIDVATGGQPMSNDDETVWITYNGEVYNFRELRRELEARGHRFRTQSDTEVVLRAYEAYGLDFVSRLRGMFAFAIWDGRARRLVLVRDRVGIKPLVYTWDGRRLLFASELKALLQDPAVPRALDMRATADYFTYLYVPSPATIFTSIRKVPPASTLVISFDDPEPRLQTYWTLQRRPDHLRPRHEWTHELRALIDETVRLHMVSDVPVGAFLSGGIDSSAVVATMASTSSTPVETFSIGFAESEYDELVYARQVAARYGTKHHEYVVTPDAVSAIPRLAWQFDEPFGDASALPTYYVSKITREHVTVALSGDGGDENFAGYRRYADALQLHDHFDSTAARSLLRTVLRWAGRSLPSGVRGKGTLESLGADPIERYFRLMTTRSLAHALTPEVRRLLPGSDSFATLARAAGTDAYVGQLQHIDINTYLPDDILTKVDRTSMLASLETRVPLLDHVLMEFAARIPVDLNLRDGKGKVVLKQAMAERVPVDILHRRKMGFGVPLERWFRNELAAYMRDILTDRRTRGRGIFAPAGVEDLVNRYEKGARHLSHQIWALLCFETWARQWLDR